MHFLPEASSLKDSFTIFQVCLKGAHMNTETHFACCNHVHTTDGDSSFRLRLELHLSPTHSDLRLDLRLKSLNILGFFGALR